MQTFLPTSQTGRRVGLAALMAAIVAATGPTATAQTPDARSTVDCGTHDRTRQTLHGLIDHHGITGATVLVTDPTAGDPCGRWAAPAGTADLRTGRPMNTTDRLRAGSVTKTFTAALVLQLVAERRLSLDAPVDRYLPGLTQRDSHDRRPITVRQLLQHTSGLPDYLDAPEWEHAERLRYRHLEPRDLVMRALELPRPQSTWHYATTNYLVLGLIVREVTGRSPEAEITRRIIKPLGLHGTYWPGDDTLVRGAHSRSYFTDLGDRRIDGTAWNMTFGGVDGALVSSPGDLTRFAAALFDGRLLPDAQLADMRRTVEVDVDRLWPGARYGLGLISTPLSCGGTWWGHAGRCPAGTGRWSPSVPAAGASPPP